MILAADGGRWTIGVRGGRGAGRCVGAGRATIHVAGAVADVG